MNGWQSAKAKNCKMALETSDDLITVVHVSGTQPEFTQLMCAVLANDCVRNLIREYQDSYQVQYDESCRYRIVSHEGVSGCQDVYLEKAYVKGGLNLVDRKYLCHISAYDKLQDEIIKLSVRQFIELASWTGICEMTQDQLKAEAEVKYFKASVVDDSYQAPRKLDV